MLSADDHADILSKRLHENLRVYNDKIDHGFKLSLSAGTVRCDPEVACSFTQMLTAADNKMYKQKKQKLDCKPR
jgi:GGDEF domain-containing protein